MKKNLLVLAGILTLACICFLIWGAAAASALKSGALKVQIHCEIEGFVQAPDNTWSVFGNNSDLKATIVYTGEIITLYNEPEHTIYDQHKVPSSKTASATLDVYEGNLLIKQVDIVACGGELFIRERIPNENSPNT